MAVNRSRHLQSGNLATFVVGSAAPGATPFAASGGPEASSPVEAIGPALAQMRLAIEDGLLMVFGPEGDPVPPHVFSVAAAAQQDALLALPDGTTTPASRVAAALRAQVLGRLGKAVRNSDWILAMLREPGGPEQASEEELLAEQETLGAIHPQSRPTPVAGAGHVANGAAATVEVPATSRGGEERGKAAARARPEEERAAVREARDRASAAAAAPAPSAPMPELGHASQRPAAEKSGSHVPSERPARRPDVGPGEMTTPAGQARVGKATEAAGGQRPEAAERETQAARAARAAAAKGAQPVAPPSAQVAAGREPAGSPAAGRPAGGAAEPARREARPAEDVAPPAARITTLSLSPQTLAREGIHALVVCDVPPGARLSAGAYSPALDGWVMLPQDLETLTVLLPPELRGDFTVTLMGLALRPGDANAVRVLAWLPVRGS